MNRLEIAVRLIAAECQGRGFAADQQFPDEYLPGVFKNADAIIAAEAASRKQEGGTGGKGYVEDNQSGGNGAAPRTVEQVMREALTEEEYNRWVRHYDGNVSEVTTKTALEIFESNDTRIFTGVFKILNKLKLKGK